MTRRSVVPVPGGWASTGLQQKIPLRYVKAAHVLYAGERFVVGTLTTIMRLASSGVRLVGRVTRAS